MWLDNRKGEADKRVKDNRSDKTRERVKVQGNRKGKTNEKRIGCNSD